LPYPAAYQLFQVLMLWSIAAFVAWWRPPGAVYALLFTAISAPLFFAFIRGQDLPLALLAIGAGAYAVRREKDFQAGLLLSLAAIRPEALLALPLVILAQRRWRLGAGLMTGLTGLAAASFAYAGLDWPERFAVAWRAAAPLDSASMPNLVGAAAWLGLDPLAAGLAAAALAAAVYLIGRRESFAAGLACAVAAGMMIAPRAHLEDTVLLLPAALTLLAAKRSWSIRICAALLLTPLGFIPQGGERHVPVLVFMGLFLMLLAGALSGGRLHAPGRPSLIQLRLT
jgi:hypothetical protein